MEREIVVNFQYKDIDGLKETKSAAYLLSNSIYYNSNGQNLTFREIPEREKGKSEINVYDSDSYRAFEIYCGKVIENISEMSAVEFIVAIMKGQNSPRGQ